jgi:hypothetical protein
MLSNPLFVNQSICCTKEAEPFSYSVRRTDMGTIWSIRGRTGILSSYRSFRQSLVKSGKCRRKAHLVHLIELRRCQIWNCCKYVHRVKLQVTWTPTRYAPESAPIIFGVMRGLSSACGKPEALSRADYGAGIEQQVWPKWEKSALLTRTGRLRTWCGRTHTRVQAVITDWFHVSGAEQLDMWVNPSSGGLKLSRIRHFKCQIKQSLWV